MVVKEVGWQASRNETDCAIDKVLDCEVDACCLLVCDADVNGTGGVVR